MEIFRRVYHREIFEGIYKLRFNNGVYEWFYIMDSINDKSSDYPKLILHSDRNYEPDDIYNLSVRLKFKEEDLTQ